MNYNASHPEHRYVHKNFDSHSVTFHNSNRSILKPAKNAHSHELYEFIHFCTASVLDHQKGSLVL